VTTKVSTKRICRNESCFFATTTTTTTATATATTATMMKRRYDNGFGREVQISENKTIKP
jgi:hypothetical protein